MRWKRGGAGGQLGLGRWADGLDPWPAAPLAMPSAVERASVLDTAPPPCGAPQPGQRRAGHSRPSPGASERPRRSTEEESKREESQRLVGLGRMRKMKYLCYLTVWSFKEVK